MSKFKIGDRVVATKTFADITAGNGYAVVEVDHSDDDMPIRVVDDAGDRYWLYSNQFRILIPALTIEPGRHYRTRSGKPTGRVTVGDTGFEAVVDGHVRIFDKAGGHVHGDADLDIVEAWVPKVGERVVFTDVCGADWWFGPDTESKEGTVSGPATYYSSEYQFDVSVEGAAYPAHVKIDHIEPLPVAAPQPAAALKIEAGKFYRTRDGWKVGPMRRFDSDSWASDGYGHLWLDSGERYFKPDRGGASDLIAEWPETTNVGAQVDTIDFSELDAAILVRKKKLKKLIKLARKAGIELREAA